MGLVGLLIVGLWAQLAGWTAGRLCLRKPRRKSRQLSDRVLTDNGGSEVVLELMFGVPPSRERSGTVGWLGKWSSWRVDAPS